MASAEPQRSNAEPEAASIQRERLVAAFAKAVGEHGYVQLELEQVLQYAGASRDTYESHFDTKEQGLLAAQEAFLDRLWLDVLAASQGPDDWSAKVRAGLCSALSSLVEASSLARVFVVEGAAVSLAAAERQFALLDRFAALLRDGRRHVPAARSLPDSTERALVGGIASIVSAHLLVEDAQAIPALESELVEFLLIPYLGRDDARRVAAA